MNIKYPAATKTIDHITNAGEPISLDEFNTKLLPIRKVKTIEEKDNILFAGGIKEVGVLEPDLSEATITAIARNMVADKDGLDTSVKPYATDAIVDTVVYVNNYGSTQKNTL